MSQKYTPEQLWKIYKNLPQELKEAIFAEETAKNIWDVCEKNEIREEVKMSQIAEYIGYVLHGVLPLDEFQEVLEKELKLKKEVAKKVFQEIHRFIFFPVKESLAALYGEEIVHIAGTTAPPRIKDVKSSMEKPEEKTSPPKPETTPDTYRESTG